MAIRGRSYAARPIIKRALRAVVATVVVPGAAAMTLTGGTPIVRIGSTVTPGGATMTLTGSAPTVSVSNNIAVTPGGATMTLTGSAPAVTVSNNQLVTPGGGTMTLTGSAPRVSVNTNVTPGGATMTLTGSAPTVSVTNNIIVIPGGGTMTLIGSAPTVNGSTVITPGGGTMTLTGGTPAVTATANNVVTPGGGSMALVGSAPAVLTPKLVTPGGATMTLTGSAPTVSVSNNKLVTPGGGTMTLTGSAPAVTATNNTIVTPGGGTMTLTGFAPTVNGDKVIRPTAATLTLTGSAPTVFLAPAVVHFVDYGYAQSELCWGTASPIPIDRSTVTRICQGIKTIGGSRVRMGVQVGSWDDLDYAINAATSAGLKPLLCILGNEALQSGSQSNAAAFGTLCRAIALRYGPSGTGQVAEYELYNEANDSFFNPPKVQAAQFVEYQKAGYTAIHGVHASAYVLPGGTVPGPDVLFGWETDPLHWYQQLYAAGAKDYMDGIAMHLYADTQAGSLPSPAMPQWKYMTDVRDLMVAQGDSAKKIWVTEVGTSNPGPGISTPVQERDWLKAMVDGILAYDWTGPFFIYSFENTDNNPTDTGASNYGCVTHIDLIPKQPKYDYCLSISRSAVNPVDRTPPSAPTGLAVTNDGFATWLPATDDVGVTVYRIYDYATSTMLCHTALIGQTSISIPGLAPGTQSKVYVTALDAAGNESAPSLPAAFTTNAQSGSQQSFNVNFALTASPPPNFVQIGSGIKVVAGVCLPNTPTGEGDWYTIAPYVTDMASTDHYCEISQSSASAYTDRYAMAGVRVSPDGKQGVFAFVSGNGQSDAAQIITIDNGVVTVRNARSCAPLGPTETLRLTPSGNTYKVERYLNGVATELVSWPDIDGVYAGSANHRPALGFRHKLVGGVYYPPNGVTAWTAMDIRAVTTTGTGGTEAWTYAIIKPGKLGRVIATGLWETAI